MLHVRLTIIHCFGKFFWVFLKASNNNTSFFIVDFFLVKHSALPDDPGANRLRHGGAAAVIVWANASLCCLYSAWNLWRDSIISILIWSDVRSRLLAKLGTLIMVHSRGFESLPSIAISPETTKKTNLYPMNNKNNTTTSAIKSDSKKVDNSCFSCNSTMSIELSIDWHNLDYLG